MIAFFGSMAGRVFLYLLLATVVWTIAVVFLALHPAQHPIVATLFVVALVALAFVIARMATRPLRLLAAAAAKLGTDIDGGTPLVEAGPTEVRDAAIAFNAMQTRIKRDLRARTYMLAAITHDLQTPLTRLRLRLEKVEDEALRAKLIEDLGVMGDTITEGLDLAKSLDASEVPRTVDLDSVLESVCDDAQESGHDVALTGRTNCSVLSTPTALRRCITNVVNNAVMYGGYARLDARTNASSALVSIRDGGPGIPENELDTVIEPFVRLEGSRSRETGGTGIGLTIAHNITTRLGGDMQIRNHPEGGLEVTFAFPKA